MNWTDVLCDPLHILSLYNKPPSLEGIMLRRLECNEGRGFFVELGIVLKELPSRSIPHRWPRAANRAGIDLAIYGVSDFAVNHWPLGTDVTVELWREAPDAIRVKCTRFGVALFSFACDLIQVSKVDGYCVDETQTE